MAENRTHLRGIIIIGERRTGKSVRKIEKQYPSTVITFVLSTSMTANAPPRKSDRIAGNPGPSMAYMENY